MRVATVMLAIGCCLSAVSGQWIETTIPLSDPMSGLSNINSIQFHSPNQTIYVGGGSVLVAVDAASHRKRARTTFPGVLDLLCSTSANKLYSTSFSQRSVWVMDCVTNQLVTTVPLDGRAFAMCYAATSNKVYVACPAENLVNVIDCGTDSVVAAIGVSSWPSALCYNPALNRIYSAQSLSDEVAVIDCAADTVVRTIWVRGVKPTALGYDSMTNCVYTANYTSGSASVIDCAGDSLVSVVAAGTRPELVVAGPGGKVYCGGYYDSAVTVIADGGTRTIPVGRYLSGMSSDPVNNKIYCATGSHVAVVDAIGDTVAARVWAGDDLQFVCYDPADTSTWAASTDGATVGVIDGAIDQLVEMLWFRTFNPRGMCYNPVNDQIYCLGQGVAVIDCDSNRVMRMVRAWQSPDSIVWNPTNNKVYFSSSADNTVSILDCAGDSITATVETGAGPEAMCCSDDGRVYVTTRAGGVAVIDPSGDSLRAFVPTPYNPVTLCYDRTDNKVYAGLASGGQVSVIDADGDSVVASVPVAESCRKVTWNQNHDKVYVCRSRSVAVIDCASDTVLRSVDIDGNARTSYRDSACDKVYVSADGNKLCIINPATDTLDRSLELWGIHSMLDNGRPGAANRLYCANWYNSVNVVSGAGDSTLGVVELGVEATGLAWNPLHSWVYVSSAGSSSIVVIRDTVTEGVEENQPQATSRKPQATVVRGVLFLPEAPSRKLQAASLMDISGRRVLDLMPGANDVRALAPGVYFVHEGGESRKQGGAVTLKVVVTR